MMPARIESTRNTSLTSTGFSDFFLLVSSAAALPPGFPLSLSMSATAESEQEKHGWKHTRTA
jgi:hypothetical protein